MEHAFFNIVSPWGLLDFRRFAVAVAFHLRLVPSHAWQRGASGAAIVADARDAAAARREFVVGT